MPNSNTFTDSSIRIAGDLDAGTVGRTYAELVSALDAIDGSDTTVLDLDLACDAAGPLALQLLVSTRRSVPADRLRLGDSAVAALTAFDHPKEI